MVNLCCVCHKLIEENEEVEMLVEGIYHSIPSANTFALRKNMKFKPGTLRHIECEEPPNVST